MTEATGGVPAGGAALVAPDTPIGVFGCTLRDVQELLASTVPFLAPADVVPDPVFDRPLLDDPSGEARRVVTARSVAGWVAAADQLLQLRLRRLPLVVDPARALLYRTAAADLVAARAGYYALAAAYPARVGLNDATSYADDLRRRWDDGLAELVAAVDAETAPGAATGGAPSGVVHGYGPPTRFPDTARW